MRHMTVDARDAYPYPICHLYDDAQAASLSLFLATAIGAHFSLSLPLIRTMQSTRPTALDRLTKRPHLVTGRVPCAGRCAEESTCSGFLRKEAYAGGCEPASLETPVHAGVRVHILHATVLLQVDEGCVQIRSWARTARHRDLSSCPRHDRLRITDAEQGMPP